MVGKVIHSIRNLAHQWRQVAEYDLADVHSATTPMTDASELLVEALREDSNLALDWLWYASRLNSEVEQRYCLLRALEIDPHHDLAHRELRKLNRHKRNRNRMEERFVDKLPSAAQPATDLRKTH